MKPLYSDKVLLQQHPLPVQFPSLQGKYFLLVWWCHSEQHHVITARTEKAVVDIYRTMVLGKKDEWDDAEPRRFFEVDIVGPTRPMRLAYAKQRHSYEYSSFKSWLSHSAKELEPEKIPGVEPCQNYVPRYKNDNDNEFYREHHMSCTNCEDGFTFDGPTMYLQLREKYVPHSYMQADEGKPSVAPVAGKDRKIFSVQDRHGHHSDGTVVDEVPKKHGGQFSNIKFFCYAEELPLPEAVVQIRKDKDEDLARLEERRKKQYEEERVREKSEHRAKIRSAVFGGP